MLNKIVIVKRDKFTVLPSLERDLNGEYTIVTKCKAGFASVSTVKASSPYEVFRRYKKGAIMNISFNSGSNRFTVYAAERLAAVRRTRYISNNIPCAPMSIRRGMRGKRT